MFSRLFVEKDDEQNLSEQINIENVDIAKATEQALLGGTFNFKWLGIMTQILNGVIGILPLEQLKKFKSIFLINDNQMRKYIPIKYTWDKNHPNYEPPIKRSRSS